MKTYDGLTAGKRIRSCCAQQTGMHILVVEALLFCYLFYLRDEQILIHIGKSCRSSACLVRIAGPCPAVPFQLAPVQLWLSSWFLSSCGFPAGSCPAVPCQLVPVQLWLSSWFLSSCALPAGSCPA